MLHEAQMRLWEIIALIYNQINFQNVAPADEQFI